MVFCCGYKRAAGKFSKCYGGYYREYSVNAKAARAIKTVFYALDVVNQGMQEKQSITVRCMDIEDLEKQAEAIRVEQIKLYELYADGVLLRDAYIEKKKALSEKLAALQDSIRTEKEEQECADELDEEIRNLTKLWGDRIFEKCGIRRDEGGDGGKTLEIRGKRRLSARDGGANYQQS